MITIKEITTENIDDVLALKVRDDQKSFVVTNAESLAKAYVYSKTAYPFAVYEEETLVGFIMMGYYEVKGYYTLWEFMIDQNYQNKGYGRQALNLGIKFVKDTFNPESIYTGVAPGNAVAKGLYESVGFVSTGLVELGMEEMKLTLKNENDN